MNPNISARLTAPNGLATKLRTLRRAAGLSQVALARALGSDQSKVSRIEGGRQLPSEVDVRAWAEACRAVDQADSLARLAAESEVEHSDWRRRVRRGLSAVQAEYGELVAKSTVIRHFETAVIPGLLQTWHYARWVALDAIRLHGDPDDKGPEPMADAKTARARHLEDRSKRFEFLLAEPVLRWLPCPPDVMLGQLDRLHMASFLPNVRFGVLPLDTRISTIPQNSFVLYDDVVRIEGFAGEDEYVGETAAKYAKTMDLLWRDALEGDEARRLVIRAAETLRGAIE